MKRLSELYDLPPSLTPPAVRGTKAPSRVGSRFHCSPRNPSPQPQWCLQQASSFVRPFAAYASNNFPKWPRERTCTRIARGGGEEGERGGRRRERRATFGTCATRGERCSPFTRSLAGSVGKFAAVKITRRRRRRSLRAPSLLSCQRHAASKRSIGWHLARCLAGLSRLPALTACSPSLLTSLAASLL